MSNFKNKYNFTDRIKESSSIRINYPDRVPIIFEKSNNNKDIPDIDKHKYLAPLDFTVGQFIYVIRNRMKLPSEKSLFLIIKNVIPPTTALLGNIYNQYQDDDKFLYITYTTENTFG